MMISKDVIYVVLIFLALVMGAFMGKEHDRIRSQFIINKAQEEAILAHHLTEACIKSRDEYYKKYFSNEATPDAK